MIYKMKLADSVDEMTFDLLEVPIEDKDIEGTADNTTIDGNVFTDYLWLKKQFVQKWSLMCEDDYTQLRGFYTRQWENAEVPTYKLFYGENVSSTDTATGNPISLTNSTDYDAPILDFEMQGNATQNGTPTPDAPVAVNTTTGENVVKITGKNLCYKTELQNMSNIRFYMNKPSGSSFTISATINVATANNSLYLRVDGVDYGVAGTLSGDANTRQSRTLTPNPTQLEAMQKGSEIYLLLYKNNAGFTLPTDAQIENSNSPTAYEPYQGQDYEVNLGKNLLENTRITTPTTTNAVTATPNADGTISLSGTASALTWFVINNTMSVPAGTYTLSGGLGTGSGVAMYNDGWGGTEIAKTVTLASKSTGNWSIRIASGTNTNGMVVKPQLEKGSTATPFAPYFTPIELAKIGTYQDKIYKDDGKWYIEKQVGKVVLDGSENWGYVTANNGYFQTTYALANIVAIDGTNAFCDHFKPLTRYSVVSATTNDLSMNMNGTYCAIRYQAYTDATAFKTWLSTHPTAVYYALATPTTTEITEQTLIDQLEAIVSAYLPRGAVNISLTGTGAQGSMVLDYELILSKETIIKDTTPVRLTLTDGGVINPCGCRQNIQLTMRETIQ